LTSEALDYEVNDYLPYRILAPIPIQLSNDFSDTAEWKERLVDTIGIDASHFLSSGGVASLLIVLKEVVVNES